MESATYEKEIEKGIDRSLDCRKETEYTITKKTVLGGEIHWLLIAESMNKFGANSLCCVCYLMFPTLGCGRRPRWAFSA
jgi:hypothetical protein